MPNDEARFDGSITTAWAQSPNRSVAVGSGWLRLVDNLIDVASVAAALLPSADGQGASRRAGHTSAVGSNSRPRSVHPRPRGEHLESAAMVNSIHCSSPPARGTRWRRRGSDGELRFIPARAGNTSWNWSCSRSPTVHPRPRGEHGARPDERIVDVGSSPPARGTHPHRSPDPQRHRFIPAWVLAPFAVGDVDVSPCKKRRLRLSFGHRRHFGL